MSLSLDEYLRYRPLELATAPHRIRVVTLAGIRVILRVKRDLTLTFITYFERYHHDLHVQSISVGFLHGGVSSDVAALRECTVGPSWRKEHRARAWRIRGRVELGQSDSVTRSRGISRPRGPESAHIARR